MNTYTNILFSTYWTFSLFVPEQTFLVLSGNPPKWSEGRKYIIRPNREVKTCEIRQTPWDIYLINHSIYLPPLHTFLQGLCCFNDGLGQFLRGTAGEIINVTCREAGHTHERGYMDPTATAKHSAVHQNYKVYCFIKLTTEALSS